MDYTVHGIIQARVLEWVAISFSRGSSQPRDRTQICCITGRFFTRWATREAQEYQGGEPIPSPADLPDPGIELGSPEYSREGNKTILSNGTHALSVLIHCSYEMSYTGFSLLPTAICLCLKTLHSCCGALFSVVQTLWQLGHVHRISEPQSKADEGLGPFQSQSHHLVSFCAKWFCLRSLIAFESLLRLTYFTVRELQEETAGWMA